VPPRCASTLLAISLLTAGLAATEPAPPVPGFWPHERGDLTPDPAMVWGQLSSGLHYAVRSNPEPRGRISLCLLVAAGSRYEQDDQRGYAHFVEHMAFQGTRRFPAGTLVQTLQRHGMAFGAEVSAFTNLTSTYYLLHLAGHDLANLDEGLRVLRDFADGVELNPDEIRREGGVILSEKRARESGAERSARARLGVVYGHTPLPRRHPIGETAVIAHADREGLLRFYETWYRPERMVVIAVGDAPSEILVSRIKAHFADLSARRPAAPEPDWGDGRPAPGVHASLYTERESGGGVALEIACVQPSTLPPTLASQRVAIARAAAGDILNLRLQAEIKKDPASFGAAGAGWDETYGRFTEASIQIQSRACNWRRALGTVEQELRRALQHGFYPSEVALSASTGLAACRFAAERAPTRQSPELVQALLADLLAGRVTQAPAAILAQAEPILASLTPEECLAALRSLWPDDHRLVFVSGNLELADPAKEIAEIYELTARFPLATTDEEAPGAFAYTRFGPTGTVAEHKHIPDLDVHLIRFANGVRLNLKKTDYEAGTVVLRVRFGRGLSAEPANQPGLGVITGACFMASALGRYDSETLGRLLRGSTVSLNFTVEDDAFAFTGGAKTADLDRLIQLITAYLTDPGWRPEGWTHALGGLGTYYATVGSDAAAVVQAVAPKIISNRDPRYGLPRFDDLNRCNFQEMRDWLAPQLKEGPMEIGVVGDFDVDAVTALAAETFGTLPPRPSRATLPCRAVNLPRETIAVEEAIRSRTPKAAIWIGWLVPGADNVVVSRRASLLADILCDRIRVKIREELGATYDATAEEWGSQADPRFSYIFVQLTAPPAQARQLAALVRKISIQLANTGVTEDEFERARQPIIAGLAQRLRHNGYWLYYILDSAQEHPDRLDWPRTRNRDYETMTREEISILARQCLGADRVFSCVVTPKPG